MSSVATDGEGWEPPGDPLTLGHQDALLERRERQCWGKAGLVWLRKSVPAIDSFASEAFCDSLRQRVSLNLYRKKRGRKKK